MISSGKNICFWITILCVVIVFWSCANMSTPAGGPKDETPPIPLKSVPENESVNFAEPKIEITFDEYVQIRNLEENFISSPPFETRPDIRVLGKRLRITFQDSLIPNATYRMQFGNAIVDVNENNPLPNFEYVFSTGEFIDSMMVRGKLQNAFSQKPEGKVSVVLYEEFHDSIARLQKPLYVTRTNEDGSFLFKNLKNSQYKILAVKDLNSNLLYDLPTEEVAFLDEFITPFALIDSVPLDSFPPLTLNLFIPDDTVQRVLFSDYIANGIVKVVTKLPARNLQVEAIPKEICYEKSISNDTITVWLPPSEKDSIFLILKDSEKIIDTIREKYYADAIDKKTLPKFLETNITSNFPYYEEFTLNFSSPLLSLDSNAIGQILPRDTVLYSIDTLYITDTIDVDSFDTISVEFREVVDTIKVFDTIPAPYHISSEGCSRKVIIDIEPVQGESYSFVIFGGGFTSIYEDTNDTISLKTTVTKEEDYGTFHLVFEGEAGSQYIIQLWDSKEAEIIQENIITNSDTIIYQNISPSEYKMKMIEDINKDGKWNSGDYWGKRQPEPIRYFDKIISIRANWLLEESYRWNSNYSSQEELILEENQ